MKLDNKALRNFIAALLTGWVTLFLFASSIQAQNVEFHTKSDFPKRTKKKILELFSDTTVGFAQKNNKAIELLNRNGYLRAVVKGKDSLFNVFTGKKDKIFLAAVRLNDSLDVLLLQNLRKYSNIWELKNESDRLKANWVDDGYPFAQYSFRIMPVRKDTILFELDFQTGDQVRFDDFFIYSKSVKNKRLVYPIISIKKGALFRQSEVNQVQENLNASGFLKTSRKPAVFFSKKKCYLGIYVEKQAANRFDGIIGLVQNEEQVFQITGFLKLKLHNIFHLGEALILDWKKNGDAFQSFHIKGHVPYLFRSRWGIGLDFKLKQIDSTFNTTTIKPTLTYQLDARQSVGVGYEMEDVKPVGLNASLPQSSSSLLAFSYVYRKLTVVKNPSKGLLVALQLFGGERKKKETDTKLKGSIGIDAYFRLYKNWTFLVGNKSGLVWHSSNDYSEAELLQFGGIYSQRGFLENEFLSRVHSTSTLELRYRFEQHSNFNLFFDQSVFVKENSLTPSLPRGFGAGMLLSTKAGQLSVSYAVGVRDGGGVSLQNGKLHFGYINHF